MGIHVHVKGQPDNCGCCALKEKLDTLWNRTSGSVTVINGVYPDAYGHITVDLLQEAAVQSIIEDYIEPMQDNLDAMNTRLDGYAHVFDDYAAIVQAVSVTLPGEIDDVQDYAEAIADDLLQNYLTKQAIISGYATKAEIQGLATRQDIQNVINGYIAKQGTATPQVISGSGGLQIAGDLAVGGDFTASGDTFVHWDNIAGAEIGPITISGSTTNIIGTLNIPDYVIAADKHPVNGKMLLAKLADYITTNTVQTITGLKAFEITTDRYITARRNNPNFNARAISTDKSTNRQDLFATLHYDVNSQEVVRDYTRIGKDYLMSEKWASFGDDNGVLHHPQIGVRTNSNGDSYAYVGGYSGTPPSTAIVYKGMMESTDGVTNNLVHTIGNEVIRGIKTHTAYINYSQGNLVSPGNYVFAQITSTDNNTLGKLIVQIKENGCTALIAQVRNANGTFKFVNLATGDN